MGQPSSMIETPTEVLFDNDKLNEIEHSLLEVEAWGRNSNSSDFGPVPEVFNRRTVQ